MCLATRSSLHSGRCDGVDGAVTVTPCLETERLLLREWRDSDRAPYAALNSDPGVMEHFPSVLTPQQSDEMVDRMIDAWQTRAFGLWAVEVKGSGEFIGFIGLSSPAWHAHFTPAVEAGWRLARSSWGHGYAPEGAQAVVAWAFEHLELPGDQLVSFTVVDNARSRRVMDKVGFVRDPADDFDHPLLPDWVHRRHVLYRLTRAAWMAGQADWQVGQK